MVEMSKFVKWNNLNSFHEVVKSLGHNRLYQVLTANDYKIEYGLKIKLHGTNAAVRIEPDGKVIAQKRSSDIPEDSDNAGFRAWVRANESFFSNLACSDRTIVIYGEWAGPGVQSGVSVSNIPTKHFFVFSYDEYLDNGASIRWYDPDEIEFNLRDAPDTLIVLPWHTTITIDFVNKETTQQALDRLNVLTESVGVNDPFIEELFNVKGSGEGFVCYPLLGENKGKCYVDNEFEHFSHFNFKAKSEHHRVNKTKAAVNFDPEKFATKNRFADAFCTVQRFEQGWREFGPSLEERRTMKMVPDFIKWVCQDVFKESETERAETNIPWSDLSKMVSSRAAIYFKNKVTVI